MAVQSGQDQVQEWAPGSPGCVDPSCFHHPSPVSEEQEACGGARRRVLEVFILLHVLVWREAGVPESRRAAGCRSPRPSALSLRQPPPALMRARCPRLAPPRRAPERRCSRRLAEDCLRPPEALPSRRASALFLYLYSPAAPPAPPSSRRARSRQPIRDVAAHVVDMSRRPPQVLSTLATAPSRPQRGHLSDTSPRPGRLFGSLVLGRAGDQEEVSQHCVLVLREARAGGACSRHTGRCDEKPLSALTATGRPCACAEPLQRILLQQVG